MAVVFSGRDLYSYYKIKWSLALSVAILFSTGVVVAREIVGIPKRGKSSYHRVMSEILLSFLGADVSDN